MKEFVAKFCGKTFCHKAPDQNSNEINEPTTQVILPKHIASGRFSWWISITTYICSPMKLRFSSQDTSCHGGTPASQVMFGERGCMSSNESHFADPCGTPHPVVDVERHQGSLPTKRRTKKGGLRSDLKGELQTQGRDWSPRAPLLNAKGSRAGSVCQFMVELWIHKSCCPVKQQTPLCRSHFFHHQTIQTLV